MREIAAFWRITYKVSTSTKEFRHHATGVPGTKRQAVKRMRAVCEKMWPTAKLRLVAVTADRQAEAREARKEIANAQANSR